MGAATNCAPAASSRERTERAPEEHERVEEVPSRNGLRGLDYRVEEHRGALFARDDEHIVYRVAVLLFLCAGHGRELPQHLHREEEL